MSTITAKVRKAVAAANTKKRAQMATARAKEARAHIASLHRVAPSNVKDIPAVLRGKIGEVKTVDFTNAGAPPKTFVISTTGQFYQLNGIQEGSSFYNRIGRKIMMRSLHIIGNMVPTGNGAGVGEYLRVLVVYDRQPNGSFPAVADVLTSYDNAGNTSSTSYDHLNMNNAERFKVLADLRYQIPNNSASTSDAQNDILSVVDYAHNEVNINRFIKLGNLESHYKASSNPAVIGDVSTGALFLMTLGNIASATAGFQINFTGRLRYTDV